VRPAGRRAPLSALAIALATLALSSALAGSLAGAQSPSPGGQVPSTLALSLAEPGPFKRIASTGQANIYATTIRAEATTTVLPAKLSLADGDSGRGTRRGYLGRGASILPTPLLASADGGPQRSLAELAPAPLRTWRVPVTAAPVRIRVTQRAPSASAVRNRSKLLWVTLTAGGP
jgi:hypothetical protein